MASGGLSLEVDGLQATLRAFQGLERDLRSQANAELRGAARTCATELAVELRVAARSCGVPVAPLVAETITVKSDRLPVLRIGGSKRVGRNRTPAGVLAWGSEQGPKGSPNRFAVAPNLAGYWIAPTVARFRDSQAVRVYLRAIVDTQRSYGLL